MLAGPRPRRGAARVADRLGRVRAHGLDVGDVEVRGVASSPTAPSAARFASGSAEVFSHLCGREKIITDGTHGWERAETLDIPVFFFHWQLISVASGNALLHPNKCW